MDKTKENILMCSKAVDIQKDWEPKAWDYVYSIEGEQVQVVSGYCTDAGYYGLCIDDYVINELGFGWEKNEYVFIPRQDQLQDMVKDCKDYKISSDYGLICALITWVDKKVLSIPKELRYYSLTNGFSMEQLWLAFVMHVKYQKQWNGTDWVKEGE